MLNSKTIFLYLQNIKKTIDNNKDEIEKLDQEIGDGDHIFNIQRGIKESLNLQDELSSHTPDEVFKKIGMKIMTTVGGSSGALFATLLIGMSKKFNVKLSDQQKNGIKDQLRLILGEKLFLNYKIDNNIIGGLIVKVGSKMIDTSLNSKINKLTIAIKGV